VKDPFIARYSFESQTPYVFVCPTYCFSIPKVVEDFIRDSRFSGSRDAYFFLTCGGSTGAAAERAEELCRSMGFNFRGLSSVKMPDNYIVLYDSPSYDESLGILRAAVSQIESTGRFIKHGMNISDPNGSSGIRALPTKMAPYFSKYWARDKAFRVTDDCIGCGKCESLCPLANISITDAKPVWNGNCTHCLACISACPVNAIEYGKATAKRRRYYLNADGSLKG